MDVCAASPFHSHGGDIPLLVVTATEGYETVKQQSAWLRVSSRSRQMTLEGGHDLHEENPDGVITEIESTLESIEAGRTRTSTTDADDA